MYIFVQGVGVGSKYWYKPLLGSQGKGISQALNPDCRSCANFHPLSRLPPSLCVPFFFFPFLTVSIRSRWERTWSTCCRSGLSGSDETFGIDQRLHWSRDCKYFYIHDLSQQEASTYHVPTPYSVDAAFVFVFGIGTRIMSDDSLTAREPRAADYICNHIIAELLCEAIPTETFSLPFF